MEKTFNNLPGKTRKVIAVVTGLFVAMTCTQLIVGAIMLSSSPIERPASLTSPILQSKIENKHARENMVWVGRMESINDGSNYRIVAIDNHGKYFISQEQSLPEQQPVVWTAITTEKLRLIEQESRFIPLSPDTVDQSTIKTIIH